MILRVIKWSLHSHYSLQPVRVKIILWLGMNCYFKCLILHICTGSNLNYEDFLQDTNRCKRNRMRFGANKLHKITTIVRGSLYHKHQVTMLLVCMIDGIWFLCIKKHCKKHSYNHEFQALILISRVNKINLHGNQQFYDFTNQESFTIFLS